VTNNPFVIPIHSPLNAALCDQVMATPEDSNIIVFNKGNPQGSKGVIPWGGQTQPISTDGAKLP